MAPGNGDSHHSRQHQQPPEQEQVQPWMAAAARQVWLRQETTLGYNCREEPDSQPLAGAHLPISSFSPCLQTSRKLFTPVVGLVYTTQCYEAGHCNVRGAPKWAEGEPWQHAGSEAVGLPALSSVQLLWKIHTSTRLQKLGQGTTRVAGRICHVPPLLSNTSLSLAIW